MQTPLLIFSAVILAAASTSAAEMTEVASFGKNQVTGVGVAGSSGRVFVNFPYWSPEHTLSVAEVKGGKATAFPDEVWNRKEGDAATRFVCVQSVVAESEDFLWILDAGSPMQKGVISGGAKLIQVDLRKNEVARIYPIGEECAPEKSYLNDVRIDRKSGSAFITESGIGSIIVVDLKSGKARRLLAGHASAKAEPGIRFRVDGIEPIDPQTKLAPTFHADGIALDEEKGMLYYHALTAHTLYRIPTSALTDPAKTEDEISRAVVRVARTAAPDGMLTSRDGGVLLAAFEEMAVLRVDAQTGETTTILKDERLQWPDTLSWGSENEIYVTASQIHRSAKFNGGKDLTQYPYKLFKITLDR